MSSRPSPFGLIALAGLVLVGIAILLSPKHALTSSVRPDAPLADAQGTLPTADILPSSTPTLIPTATTAPPEVSPTPQFVVAYAAPGTAPVHVLFPSDTRPIARCPTWPQLVRVRDAVGTLWWVSQQDVVPPDPRQLGPDGLLPIDPLLTCRFTE